MCILIKKIELNWQTQNTRSIQNRNKKKLIVVASTLLKRKINQSIKDNKQVGPSSPSLRRNPRDYKKHISHEGIFESLHSVLFPFKK